MESSYRAYISDIKLKLQTPLSEIQTMNRLISDTHFKTSYRSSQNRNIFIILLKILYRTILDTNLALFCRGCIKQYVETVKIMLLHIKEFLEASKHNYER